MEQPLVSVIIPVWNGETQIGSCLSSIMMQDYAPMEIVVIDDASDDRSLDQIRTLTSGYDKVKVVAHKDNLGLGSTLNEGIKQALGEFVLVVHQDCELMERQFVSRAVSTLRASPDVGALTGRRVYQVESFSSKEKLFMVANGHIAEMDHDWVSAEELTFIEDKCDLYRKQVLDAVGGFPADRFRTSGEDQVLSSMIRESGFRLLKVGHLSYRMTFGQKESTIRGILAKLRVYGRTQAGVLWTVRGSALERISDNGQFSRALNRLAMILAATAMVGGLLLSTISPYFLFFTLSAFLIRCWTYIGGLVRLHGHLALAVFGPFLDMFYSLGFAEGLVLLSVGRKL